MQEFITIDKDPNLKSSQDYDLLKETGLKHIESLASDLWTDYNEHDPGVTLLEVLAYAITDLGYRTDYDVKDLLTAETQALNNHKDTFHKAKQILPCNQVTELDLREILIDIKGVRNAWIKISKKFENTYFVDYDASVLSISDPVSTTEEEVTTLNGLYHIVIEFDRLVIPITDPDREEKQKKILGQAKAKLMEYRNFCEDYFVENRNYPVSNTSVTKVVTKPKGFEKIVLWADIEVTAESDKEKVHAQIYFDIEQFLIPYVTFYSLKERLKNKKTIDEIFEGPLLKHGFIDEDELEKIELLECIHTSDLYQVVMDVPGVKAVKSLRIANYLSDNGLTPNIDSSIEDGGVFSLKKLLDARGEDWCLELSSDANLCEFYELVLETVTTSPSDPINNTIKFYTGENSVPVSIDTLKSLEALDVLRQNDRKRRERLGNTSFELEVPAGTNQEVDVYYPTQNELPLVYGTGLDGLADDVSNERKGQAKQLKGYMLFFEQLLTNYLAQLNNVRHLFSWDDTIDKTYYTQLVEGIKDRGDLYVENFDGSALSPSGMLDENRMGKLIQQDTENADVYFDRRSRFLNHLIARFNEKFVEYSMIMHSLEMEDQLIPDKAKFLQEYDEISMNRGRGFDFTKMRPAIHDTGVSDLVVPDVWDTFNVTGYQHRVCRFLGLTDQSRRFLFSGHNMRIELVDVIGLVKYRYRLIISDITGTEIVGSNLDHAELALTQFEELIENHAKDNVTNTPLNPSPSEFVTNITDADTSDLLGMSTYSSVSERTDGDLEIVDYFNNVSAFNTALVEDGMTGKWTYTIEVSSAVPSFSITSTPPLPSEADAQNALDDFMNELKGDTIGFTLPSIGSISNNEFYFQVVNHLGVVIAKSDFDVFAGSRDASIEGMNLAEVFFDDSIGYKNSEGGLHVVEHILLRPKADNYALFDVDVKQYDSIKTAENPPVAYPIDYDGVYRLQDYHEQFYLSKEVELTTKTQNPSGEIVNIIEPYFYTISENQIIGDDKVAATSETWNNFFNELRNGDLTKFQLKQLGDKASVDNTIWEELMDGGLGCDYTNYSFGTLTVNSIIFNYYFIMDEDTVLGGLVFVADSLSPDDVKARALRAFAYFCENTTCKGVANPYEFRSTVVLPAWTKRAKDYNYREYAEEIIRLEAPAHVAMDIKWVNRAQMREFEICYWRWLTRQGEFLALDRAIQGGEKLEVSENAESGGLSEVLELSVEGGEMEEVFEGSSAFHYLTVEEHSPIWLYEPTNISTNFFAMSEAVDCLVDRLSNMVDAFQSAYKTVVRNNEYFTGDTATNGTLMAWVSESADGSVVNKAELVGGLLPSFLGFFTGNEIESTSGIVVAGIFDAGDFMVLNHASVIAGEWTFSVKTYSDTGQVSCTPVTIIIIQDLEAEYVAHPKCYSHLVIGDIVSEISDPNGVIFSAEILGVEPLPPGLKLLLNHTDLESWTTLKGLDAGLYQPGDIVVDDNTLTTYPVNDPKAIPSEGNIISNLIVRITDITGGKTIFTMLPNLLNSNGAPDYVPILIYGNAGIKVTPAICDSRHIATYNLDNTVYGSPSDFILEFQDLHEPEGITLVSAALTGTALSGLNWRIVGSRIQIYVHDFALFEAYVENPGWPNVDGVVKINLGQLSLVDSCGYTNTCSETHCIRLDSEAEVEEIGTIEECRNIYQSNSQIVRVLDNDGGIVSYILSPTVEADLLALGVSHQRVSDDGVTPKFQVLFEIENPALFRNAIQSDSIFNGTETVNNLLVNVYEFSIDTVDFFGGTSSSIVKIYAPANAPLVCTKAFPDGTSYLAYIYSKFVWNPSKDYFLISQKIGKTVMTFTDGNGIESINCSCKTCLGRTFPVKPLRDHFGTFGVLDIPLFTVNGLGQDFGANVEENSMNFMPPMKAASGSRKRQKRSVVSEYPWKVKGKSYSKERYIKSYVNEQGEKHNPYKPKPTCDCLEKIGLALNKTSNTIYVKDAYLFAEKGVGTHKFSVTVIDGCGITTCKNVTLKIGKDKEAYYVDVKNNNYLNTLSNGDIIGYPEDPDGSIVHAQLVTQAPGSDMVGIPHTPHLILPPGTEFNTYTGKIRVDSEEDSEDTVVYSVKKPKSKGAANPENKTSLLKETEDSSVMKSNNIGFSLFSNDANTSIEEGVAAFDTSWNIESSEFSSPLHELENAFENAESAVSPWLKNSGKLTSGTWHIHVLTRDVYGGVTIIDYTITIRKSRLVKGVLDNTKRGGYIGLKDDIVKNYSNIFSSKKSKTIKKESDINSIGGMEANTLNKINTKKRKL